jgi:hypothetical protein
MFSNPEGVASSGARFDATPLGLKIISQRTPRVARASQPRAERRYPVGVNPIEMGELVHVLHALMPEEIKIVDGAAANKLK